MRVHALLLAHLLLLLAGCGGRTSEPQPEQPAAPGIQPQAVKPDDPLQLQVQQPPLEIVRGLNPYNSYMDHGELKTDLQIKNKLVEFKAHFSSTTKINGRYAATFVTASGRDGIFTDLYGHIAPTSLDAFASLKQNTAIVVRGKVLRKEPRQGTFLGWVVLMDELELVQTLQPE